MIIAMALAEAGEILGWLGDPRPLEEFVEIQGGEYDFGGDLGKANLKPFEIGKYPVANRWFERFIEAGGYKEERYWTGEGRKWLEYTKTQAPEYWHERKWNCPNAPVVGVSWWEADAFCRWLTEAKKDEFVYRLPTEEEWQAVAAGKEGRKYPWGDWEEGRCNTEESGIGKTSAVGIFENGNTPDGVADMSGNVWEWTSSDYYAQRERDDFLFDEEIQSLFAAKNWDELSKKLKDKDRHLPSLRGGSWDFNRDFSGCAGRGGDNPDVRGSDAGFRCARTFK